MTWWTGLLVSVLIHALLFVAWRGDAVAIEDAASGERPARLVAGGGAVLAVRVERPERRDIPPPPKPVLAVETPQIEVQDFAAELAGPDLLPSGQNAKLPGIGGGPDQGDGGQGGGGDGYVSPVPRSVLPHWDPPSSVRGMEVTVRVFVDEHGQPTGLVELHPPTPDDGFNREIRDRIRRMEYRPASRHGAPVAGWAEITFIF